eukprot:1848713-Rhodomonas_salina.2
MFFPCEEPCEEGMMMQMMMIIAFGRYELRIAPTRKLEGYHSTSAAHSEESKRSDAAQELCAQCVR